MLGAVTTEDASRYYSMFSGGKIIPSSFTPLLPSRSTDLWDFPGSPVAKTSSLTTAGITSSIPGQGTKILHHSRCRKKKKNHWPRIFYTAWFAQFGSEGICFYQHPTCLPLIPRHQPLHTDPSLLCQLRYILSWPAHVYWVRTKYQALFQNTHIWP